MKNQKGITLVALVVTIVILIILSGIAVNLLFNENGILAKVKQAKQNSESAQETEKKDLDKLYSSILIATNDSAQITISIQDLKTLIKEEVEEQVKSQGSNPIGTVITYIAGNDAPQGYLKCDGTIYNINDYKELAEQIKIGFGSYNYYGGDGETTFAVPDLRGEFLRGTGTNGHTTQGNGASIGTHQDSTVINRIYYSASTDLKTGLMSMYIDTNRLNETLENPDKSYKPVKMGAYQFKSDVNFTSSTSNNYITSSIRPTNTSVLYCIKY